MLPYSMRSVNATQGRGLKCSRCDIWIGSNNPELCRVDHFFTHCEICTDTLCEYCSHEYILKPVARVNQLMENSANSMDPGHWANRLSAASWRGTDQLKNIYEVLDIHRKGQEQWRRNDWSMLSMRKTSTAPWCYVPDAVPYEDWELAQEQRRQNNLKRDHNEIDIQWSCCGNHPP